MILNQNGFSLVETMLAMGITLSVTVFIGGAMRSVAKVSVDTNKMVEVQEKISDVKAELGSPDSCSPNLTAANIPTLSFDTTSLSTVSIPINKLQAFPSGNITIEVNETFGSGLTVKSLSINQLEAMDDDTYIGKLMAEVEVSSSETGVSSLFRDTLITLKTTGSGPTKTVTECATEPIVNEQKGFENTLSFNEDGTFVVPGDVTEILVEAWGGGGGGGGSAGFSGPAESCGGGGGGGGAYEQSKVSVTPGETITIDIGFGGAGGAKGDNTSVPGSDGGDGEDTYFGNLVRARGGLGGQGCQLGFISMGGAGGQSLPGEEGTSISVPGNYGGDSGYSYAIIHQANGGNGGGSFNGGGNAAQSKYGVFPAGGGGGGTKFNDSSPVYDGGSGSRGMITIKY